MLSTMSLKFRLFSFFSQNKSKPTVSLTSSHEPPASLVVIYFLIQFCRSRNVKEKVNITLISTGFCKAFLWYALFRWCTQLSIQKLKVIDLLLLHILALRVLFARYALRLRKFCYALYMLCVTQLRIFSQTIIRVTSWPILSVNLRQLIFRQRGKQKSVDWYRFTASSDSVSIHWVTLSFVNTEV